tara:strand:- start:6359 stop:6748 length:390 start_codon:yes stop_codon:yes gene_type:complete
MTELTEKQAIFCEEYVKDFNATRSAKAAGYSEQTARQTGHENLTKPYIKERINLLKAERMERLSVDKDKVVKELAKIGLSENGQEIPGFYIEMKDKIRALELLGRHTNAFSEDDSGKGVIIVKIGKDVD